VVDAYALIGDVSGLAEKIQSFFMQEVLSETHSAVKSAVQEDQDMENLQNISRLTYSDLCLQIPESKFRQCLLRTLAVLFRLMSSYYAIMSFQADNEVVIDACSVRLDDIWINHDGVAVELSVFVFLVSFGADVLNFSVALCVPFFICVVVYYLLTILFLFRVSQMHENLDRQHDFSQKPEEFQLMNIGSGAYDSRVDDDSLVATCERLEGSSTGEYASRISATVDSGIDGSLPGNSSKLSDLPQDDNTMPNSGSPWFELRRDAAALVSQSLQRGCKNFWQLMTSRVSVLISSAAFCSTSIHQFLKNYEELNTYILAGEAFCGVEASEFRNKLKAACESYFSNFHKQNIYSVDLRCKYSSMWCENAVLWWSIMALKMVLEKECWQKLPPDAIQVVSFAGLVGDGAPIIASSGVSSMNDGLLRSNKSLPSAESGPKQSGFCQWFNAGNPFLMKVSSPIYCHTSSPFVNGASDSLEPYGTITELKLKNSQLPSRISKSHLPRNHSSQWRDDEVVFNRLMDKYARLMQKLGMVNVELFKGLCQLFEIYYHFVFDTFGHQDSHANGKGISGLLIVIHLAINFVGCLADRLKTAVNRITQDCEQWLKHKLLSSSMSLPVSLNSSVKNMDFTPTVPPGTSIGQSPGLKVFAYLYHYCLISYCVQETCAAADTVSLIARILHRSKPHLQSMLLQNNPAIVEDFFVYLVISFFVDSVPDLTEHIYRSTARSLLHINGYVDRIANAKWEVKELGMEHNGDAMEYLELVDKRQIFTDGKMAELSSPLNTSRKDHIEHCQYSDGYRYMNRYVDLLLGEFKHYRTRLAHAGIHNEVMFNGSDLIHSTNTLIRIKCGWGRLAKTLEIITVQEQLLEHGVEIVAETLVEGVSRVKKCTDEGRALMSLDLQVLINGLQHFVSKDVKPKLHIVEAFIKAYYLPETEYVYWARAHPEENEANLSSFVICFYVASNYVVICLQEYSKSQVVGLVNLVATMKSWKRKTRLETVEKIEGSSMT
ncbi:Syndetin, partial [Bienertia sinuspersici]